MHKLYLLALVIVSSIVCSFVTQIVGATNSVVISQVQVDDRTSAKNELIEIYNNSSTDMEVTNWCLHYASATSEDIGSKLSCFLPDNDGIHIYLPAYSLALAVSNQLATATIPNLGSDLRFSATLSDTAGHVRLIDNNSVELDKLGWGVTAVSPEGTGLALIPTEGKVFQRKSISPNTLQDTDVNGDDFELVLPRIKYNYGSIYEVQDLCLNITGIQAILPDGYSADVTGNCISTPIDVCTNLDGLQTIIPKGYGFDIDGKCQVDLCQNIDGLQQILPDGMELDDSGNCALHDECSNLNGIQSEMPDGYDMSDDYKCMLDLLPLQISELLPNVIGSDEGKEFIEIYNSNDSDVDLANYVFYIGTNEDDFYNFPIESHVGPNQYMVFYNDEIKFTLLNTTSIVRLKSIDGTLIDETPAYSNPKDDLAWALIDDTWQYTNQPTSGSKNLPSLIKKVESEIVIETESSLKPCAANQYRSPETNRCRLIATSSTTESVLAPCKDGQYRSEETNRCRNIASDVSALTPCAEGQERNPETNRCRSITAVLGDSELAPCKEGQERNPETNRCRNIVSMPQAEYAPEQTAGSSNGYIGWLALAGVGLVAIIYAIWEWRHEIAGIIRKIKLKINRKKDSQI